MEVLFGIAFVYFIFWLFGTILGAAGQGASAAYKTVTEGGSFTENFSNAFAIKIEKRNQNENVVYMKGAPSISHPRDLLLVLKLFDKGEGLPIVSTFEASSEIASRVYEKILRVGRLDPGQYWPNWIEIGDFTDEEIVGARKGRRHLTARVFLWDTNHPPQFHLGFPEDNTGAVDLAEIDIPYNFINVGFRESQENKIKIQGWTVQLAIGLAMADGSLARSEGNKIKKWMKEMINEANETDKNKTKVALNKALEIGSVKANEGKTNINYLCKKIDENASMADKYDALELCLDVMSADGKADENELQYIEKISKNIGIDYNEITKLKERRMLDLELPSAEEADVDKTLGINPSWTKEEKKKHVMSLYRKYNGRINSAKDEQQKKNAQTMLDLCGRAMKKYG
jgi:tellurite resistance protein